MPLRIADDDPTLNPGQTHADEQFNGLNKAEENGNVKDGTKNTDDSTTNNIDKIKNAEDNPNSDWKNNVSGEKPDTKKAGGRFSFIKKKGPLATIILTVVGGGIGIGGLLSPGLLIVNLKEMMVGKFNAQLTSMDIRTNKILKNKTLGNFGVCTSVVSIACKYSSMSDKQIANFKKAGIDIEIDESKTILGRNKPKSFKLEGDDITITPAKFADELASNPKFRTAVKKGYNPLFAGFADKIGNKVLFTFGGKKGVKLNGDTPEEKLGDIQNETKNTVDPDIKGVDSSPPDASDTNKYPSGETDANYTKDLDDFTAAKKLGTEVLDEAADIASDGIKAASKTTVAAAKTAASALSITGIADNLCTVYGSIRAVGFAAKTVRALQLAKYAMIFLTIADQIKAGGNPNPDDVSYLGSVLTAEVSSVVKDSDGNIIKNADGTDKTAKKTATDSFGYKYAAYGETGTMPDTATQFLAGGGLAGSLIMVTSMINNTLGKTPNDTCKVLNNVLFQIGSITVGIGAAIASGGLSITVKGAIQIGMGIAVSAAIIFLPALLKDIVAGVVVDENTVGELAGDAITSGSSSAMGKVASVGGNAPLTVAQAVAYQDLSSKVANQYAEEDRLAYSPFDITNKNTFMGSFFTKIVPYLTRSSSLAGTLSSAASMVSSSFSSVLPITKATSDAEYSYCKDLDYVNLGVAADPYCNIAYGIPTQDLEIDPLDVLTGMSGEIDNNGNAVTGSKYQEFITKCMNRTTPLGYTGDSFSDSDGSECIIGSGDNTFSKLKYYYLFQIDQRVEHGMDGTDETLNLAMDSGLRSDIGFYDGSNGIYNNIADTSNQKIETNISGVLTNDLYKNIQTSDFSSTIDLLGFSFVDNTIYGL